MPAAISIKHTLAHVFCYFACITSTIGVCLSARLKPEQARRKQQASSPLPRICLGFATKRLFWTAENGVTDLEGTLSNVLLSPVLGSHHVFFSCFFVGRQKEIVSHSPPLHSWAFTTALLQTAFKMTFLVCASLSLAWSEEKMHKSYPGWMNEL